MMNIGETYEFVQCKKDMEGMRSLHGRLELPGKVPAPACLSSPAVSDCGGVKGIFGCTEAG